MTTKKSTTAAKKTYINEVASVLSSEKGGNYIKFNKDVTLPAGAKLFITPMDEHIQGLVERGVISEQEAERRLEKLPSYVLSTVTAVIG